MDVDEFGNGVALYDETTWRKMVADACQKLALKSEQNVLEIGCGGGAFIYAANEIVNANWYGVDYSKNLVQIAQKAIPEGRFLCNEAINPSFSSTIFDAVLSHSVFQYFPSIHYAEEVLKMWCGQMSSKGHLILLDINDAESKLFYHFERMKEYKDLEEYKAFYKGLDHLFFDKIHLSEFLSSIGMHNISFFPHCNSNYKYRKFRFNLICEKL